MATEIEVKERHYIGGPEKGEIEGYVVQDETNGFYIMAPTAHSGAGGERPRDGAWRSGHWKGPLSRAVSILFPSADEAIKWCKAQLRRAAQS